ncbi:MAG: protoporphyrinogen oxidase [Betaproteobacteria bacterium]|nr:protoporphyrinogen oxidase [Betaproteobacteria bacterium]
MNIDSEVLVIGAGISGLATAFRLARRGIGVAVIDAAPRPGGVIGSERRDGVLYERGPNSTLDTGPFINEMLGELGILGERIDASAISSRRFIVRGGRLIALPTSPPAFLGTPLFSLGAKLRLVREPFIARAPANSEESVAQFVVRRLGREFLDYAIEPFVAGVYAGDAARLSLPAAFPRLNALEQRYGSLIKGQVLGARERAKRAERSRNVAASFSFREGMQTLTDALARAVGRVETERRATGVRRLSDGAIAVTVEHAGATTARRARAVVLAVPADRAAELVREFAADAARALDAIPYAAVASVASAYRRSDVEHPLDGFGVLVPKVEKRRILGSLFSSSMFDGRAPRDTVLLTTFVGGDRDPHLPSRPAEEVAAIAREELGALLGARGAPLFCAVTHWPRAIPQYVLGHLDRIRRAEQAQAALPGLFLCASYRGGISVGDCMRSGCQTADVVADFLGARSRDRD